MADVLTQLQTCYDQLATQLYASLSYISSHHAYIPPEPLANEPFSVTQPMEPAGEAVEMEETLRPYRPDSPQTFTAAQKELARDLVLKEQQIEELIQALPGIGSSEKEQEQRIKVLGSQLRDIEQQRRAKRKQVRELMEKVEDVVMDVAGQGIGGSLKQSNGVGQS